LYKNIDINLLKDIFNFYNKIINKLGIDHENNITDDDFIYKMIDNNIIKDFENNKILEIPEIAKKFSKLIDTINIIDFQDAFIILYEYIYSNKFTNEIIDTSYLEELFDSIITNIRANKLIKTNKSFKSFKLFNIITDNNDLLNISNHEFNNYEINYQINDYDNDNDDNNYDNHNNDNDNHNNDNDDDYKKSHKKYKLKYKNEKEIFNKLSKVKSIITDKNFNKDILNNYNEINDDLIELIINYVTEN